MANDYSNQPLTGRYDRKQVQPVSGALMAFPVLQDRLEDSKDVVNDTTKSGKQTGAMFCVAQDNYRLTIAISKGSNELDNWSMITPGEMITPQ
ncbi:hypothetical protein [Escherichia coli]|uniref:hypothetical protein n=1 Tax=Escherichia coli TaxID=562 RepID=UPI003F6664B2